jgi:hypothetical protein
MSTREIILIAFVPVLVYLIINSIATINKYDKTVKPINKSVKYLLIYLSILVPPVGYLLTRKMRS